MREQKNVYVVNGTALSKRLKMIYPHTWNMVKFNGQYSHIDVGVKTINKFNPIPYSTLKNSYFVVYRRGLGNI